MGFFSSKKDDDNANYVAAMVGSNDKAVVQVIRSRFYGKKRGKNREEAHYSSPSAAPAISAIPISSEHPPLVSTSFARESKLATDKPSSRRPTILTSPSRRVASDSNKPMPPSPKSISSQTHTKPLFSLSRKHIDTATMTLAEQLDELAVANSDGLLNDDEYRLLRRNLFDRYASTAVVPTEVSVVPVARPRPPKINNSPEKRSSSGPLSKFHMESPRSSAFHRNSMTFSVVDMFRRATSHSRGNSMDRSDASSIWSSASGASNIFKIPRRLSRKSSNSSIGTSVSRAQTENISIPHATDSNRGHFEYSNFATSRSGGSTRKMTAPPSSFSLRGILQDNKCTPNMGSFDDENFKTANDIEREIHLVEAESKRILDAFNGLEITAMAKLQRHRTWPSLQPLDAAHTNFTESSQMANPDSKSQKRINGDTNSMHSCTSSTTGPSMVRSMYSVRRGTLLNTTFGVPLTLDSPLISGRQNESTHSLTSHENKQTKTHTPPLPPVPSLPSKYASLSAANQSNVSLIKSTRTLARIPIPEEEAISMPISGTVHVKDDPESQMEDIRRRKDEVTKRYAARLDFLRVKLKGAQLHEKLMRK